MKNGELRVVCKPAYSLILGEIIMVLYQKEAVWSVDFSGNITTQPMIYFQSRRGMSFDWAHNMCDWTEKLT